MSLNVAVKGKAKQVFLLRLAFSTITQTGLVFQCVQEGIKGTTSEALSDKVWSLWEGSFNPARSQGPLCQGTSKGG